MSKSSKDKQPQKAQARLGIDDRKWYKLDNAALVFIPAHSRTWTAVFRIAAVMREPVDPEILQTAVNDILPRFPTFAVTVKTGFFWNYLQTSDKPLIVERDRNYPCKQMNIKSGRHLIRVLYDGNRISFESFHAVTDGGGGLIFLTTLIARYLELRGVQINERKGCLDHLDQPRDEETEDAFSRFASAVRGGNKGPLSENKSYQIKLPKEEAGIFNIIHGTFSAKKLYDLGKKFDASVGQFLLAVLFKAVLNHRHSLPVDLRRKDTRPLKITASVDLRKRFGSSTLRNFSTFMNMCAEDGEYTLEQLVALVKTEFGKMDKHFLQNRIDTLTGFEHKLIVRILPLFVKNLALNFCYWLFGETLSAMALSNFGRLEVPTEFYDHVVRYETMLGPQKVNSIASSCLTFGDTMVMTFSSKSRNAAIECEFFRILTEHGIDVTIDTNRRDCVLPPLQQDDDTQGNPAKDKNAKNRDKSKKEKKSKKDKAAAPTIAAPTVQEPVVAEPTIAEPTIAAPTVQEPVVAEPTIAAPTIAAPTVQEPVAAESKGSEGGDAL